MAALLTAGLITAGLLTSPTRALADSGTATLTVSGSTSLKVCVADASIYGNAVFVIPLLPLKAHRTS